MKRVVAAIAALAVSASPAGAVPRKKDAKAAFDRGVAAYQRDDWAKAAAELEKSFDLEEDIETLYAWAQAERQLEDCEKASELYRKLLKFDLPDENKEVIREKLEECRQILDPETDPAEGDPDLGTGRRPGEATAPVDAPPPAPTRRTPWYTDVLGDSLLGAGTIAVVVGTGFLVSGWSASNAAQESYADFDEHNERAESHGRIGTWTLTLGGVLVGAAIIRYATRAGEAPAKRRRAEADESAAITPWLAPDGGGVAAFGRF